MKKPLSPYLITWHQKMLPQSSSRKIRTELRLAMSRIFGYLRMHTLSSDQRVLNDDADADLLNDDITEWNLSPQTLNSTGCSWLYYTKMRHTSHSRKELMHCIESFMTGQVSLQALKHVGLINLIQIAYDMQIPVEYLVYGTTDPYQIALYNYRYYDSLEPFPHQYFSYRMKKSSDGEGVIRKILFDLRSRMSIAEMSRKIDLSRQSLYNYFSPKGYGYVSYMPSSKRTYDAICKLAHKNPVKLLQFPPLTRRCLHKLSAVYARDCKKRFR